MSIHEIDNNPRRHRKKRLVDEPLLEKHFTLSANFCSMKGLKMRVRSVPKTEYCDSECQVVDDYCWIHDRKRAGLIHDEMMDMV